MTLAEAQAMLAAAETAYASALNAHSVGTGDKSVRYQELSDLKDALDYWERKVNTLEAAANSATNPGVRIATWS